MFKGYSFLLMVLLYIIHTHIIHIVYGMFNYIFPIYNNIGYYYY